MENKKKERLSDRIPVTEETRYEVNLYKVTNKFKDYDEAIKDLLDKAKKWMNQKKTK